MNEELYLQDGATFPTKATLDMMAKVYRWSNEADSFRTVIPQTGSPWEGWFDLSSLWTGLECMRLSSEVLDQRNCAIERLNYIEGMRRRGRRVRRNFDVMDSAFTPKLETLHVSSRYSPEIIRFIGRNSPFHKEPRFMLTAMFQYMKQKSGDILSHHRMKSQTSAINIQRLFCGYATRHLEKRGK